MPSIDPNLILEVVIAAVPFGIWFAAFGLALLLTRPAEVQPQPGTQELGGAEPPAVVSLLVNRWEVIEDAAESTLIDLAARRYLEIRQPGNEPMQTTIHVNPNNSIGSGQDGPGDLAALNAYERRVYERVAGLAVGGVVPLSALTFRDKAKAETWAKHLRAEVVADARRLGLSRRRFRKTLVTGVSALGLLPALGLALAVLHYQHRHHGEYGGAFWAALGTVVALSTLAGLPRGERDTPAGREVAARWLGLKTYLRNDASFAQLPPSAVAVWDRYLSYGDALGTTRICSAVIDLGMGNRKRVWSSFGGTWHRVRVRYPTFWSRYGQQPLPLMAKALIPIVLGFLVLRGWRLPVDAAPAGYRGLAGLVAVLLGLVLLFGGLYRLVRTIFDVALPVTLTGEVLWIEVWKSRSGGEDSPPVPYLYYLAVDDGRDDRTTAWAMPSELFGRCDCGDVVQLTARRWTRRVVELSVVRHGSAARLAAADVTPPSMDDPGNVLASALSAPGVAAGRVLAGALAPVEVQAAQLLTDDEVSRAVGQPVQARGGSNRPVPGPVSIESYHTVAGDRRVLQVIVSQGATARLAMRTRRRNTPLPGIGDEAFTGENWAAGRRGDTVVLVQMHGPGRGADPRSVYWLLATAVGRLPA
jgi:hypothetical protein